MSYDLALYSVPTGTTLADTEAVLTLGWANTGPKRLSGVTKLMQMAIKLLMDGLGSASYDTSLGTDFMDLIFRVYEETEAYAVVSTAVQIVAEKMKTENDMVSDEDEQLDRIEIEDIEKSTSYRGWNIKLRVYAVSGVNAEYLFGLSQ